jgi:hypothetical protein
MSRYGAEDPMARAFLDWAVRLMGAGSWRARRETLIATLSPSGALKSTPAETAAGVSVVPVDLAAWYLLQVERWLEDAASYDVMSGSRFMPIVHRLGHGLEALTKIEGAETRMRRVLRKAPAEIDSVLFELLVALAYQERTSGPVAFIAEGTSKTPDLRIGGQEDPFFVECKRKFRAGDYARDEYRRFALLYEPVRKALKEAHRSWACDFVFHREMMSYPDDYLAQRVIPLLAVADPVANSWRTLLNDDELRIAVRAADWPRYRRQLGQVDVRGETPQLYHVLFDHYDPSRGYQASVGGAPSAQSPGYWEEVVFACVGIWSCDAPEAVQAKTRHQQAELRKAFAQLPADARGAVHVANETFDDERLADERRRRIATDLWKGLDATRRELQWVYLHLFAFDVPPNESWSAGETCVSFAASDARARVMELEPKLLLEPTAPYPAVTRVQYSS